MMSPFNAVTDVFIVLVTIEPSVSVVPAVPELSCSSPPAVVPSDASVPTIAPVEGRHTQTPNMSRNVLAVFDVEKPKPNRTLFAAPSTTMVCAAIGADIHRPNHADCAVTLAFVVIARLACD